MNEIYEFEGQTYDVNPNKLEAFLSQFPEATKVDAPGKTTGPALDTDSGSGDGFSELPKHIDFKNLQKVDSQDATWFDELFNSEANVLGNLQNFYKGQNVSFDSDNTTRDRISVRNKAGDREDFLLPSSWNKNRVGGLGSFVTPIIGEREVGTWEEFHSNVTNFIESGNKNIDPEKAKQQDDVKFDLNKLLNSTDTDSIVKQIIPDWDGDWEQLTASGDKRGVEEKDELVKALMKRYGSGTNVPGIGENMFFGFNEEFNQLEEEDIEYAIENMIELKAKTQIQKETAIKKKEDQSFVKTDQDKALIIKAGDDSEIKNMKEEEQAVVAAWAKFDGLVALGEDAGEKEKIDAKKQLDLAKANLGFFNKRRWTTDYMVLGSDGQYVDNVLEGQSSEQVVVSKEEYEARKDFISTKVGGRRGGVRDASNLNHVQTHASDKRGKVEEEVVINDEDAFIAMMLENPEYYTGRKTENGYVFKAPVSVLAGNYDRIIKGDGYDMWTRFKTRNMDDINLLREEFNNSSFKSTSGYFGKLEFDKDQTFTTMERLVLDEDEYSEVDQSKGFKRDLKQWRDDRKSLMTDRKVLTDMHLMNIDPGSNTLSFSMDLDKETPGETTVSLDFIPRSTEILYEGFGDMLGFGEGEMKDLNFSSKRAANDALEQTAANYTTVELRDEQKERIKRSGSYKVFEAVTGFVPAITEFALLDIGLKGVGAITGVPRLVNNLTRTYKMGKKGSAIGAGAIAKEIGYKGSLTSVEFEKAIATYKSR